MILLKKSMKQVELRGPVFPSISPYSPPIFVYSHVQSTVLNRLQYMVKFPWTVGEVPVLELHGPFLRSLGVHPNLLPLRCHQTWLAMENPPFIWIFLSKPPDLLGIFHKSHCKWRFPWKNHPYLRWIFFPWNPPFIYIYIYIYTGFFQSAMVDDIPEGFPSCLPAIPSGHLT